jgi:transcriptional regulator with XRE-family HTH domain
MTAGERDPLCGELREIRRQLGLSLQVIEEKSDGRWKSVVVGSYERGDRQPAVRQARELLDFYGYRLAVLGPNDVVVRGGAGDEAERVEHLVVYGDRPQDRATCRSAEHARRLAARIPGSRVAYRVHIVGELTFVSDAS